MESLEVTQNTEVDIPAHERRTVPDVEGRDISKTRNAAKMAGALVINNSADGGARELSMIELRRVDL